MNKIKCLLISFIIISILICGCCNYDELSIMNVNVINKHVEDHVKLMPMGKVLMPRHYDYYYITTTQGIYKTDKCIYNLIEPIGNYNVKVCNNKIVELIV